MIRGAVYQVDFGDAKRGHKTWPELCGGDEPPDMPWNVDFLQRDDMAEMEQAVVRYLGCDFKGNLGTLSLTTDSGAIRGLSL